MMSDNRLNRSNNDRSDAEAGAINIESNIPARFSQIAAQFPRHIALVNKEVSLTYSQLERLVRQISRDIIDSGLNKDAPVAVYTQRSHLTISSILAVWASGHPLVVLEPSNPIERNSGILQDSAANAMLIDNATKMDANRLTQGGQYRTILVEEYDRSRERDLPPVIISPHDTATIVYTSGTTGKPKGIFTSHRNLLHAARRASESLGIKATDRWLLTAAFSHNGGIMGLLRTLLNGGALYPLNLRERGTGAVLEKLIEDKITIYHSVPAVFRQVAALMTGSEELPDLRWVLLGGDRLFRKDVELFQKRFPLTCAMINQLGCTELSGYSQFIIRKNSEITRDEIPVGKPMKDIDVRIVDSEGNEIGDGEQGFIELESEFLAQGYWQRPELTRERFLPSSDGSRRRYQPGDIGKYLPDGNLVHLGRIDRQIKIRGFRFDIEGVEQELRNLDAVREAVVVRNQPADRDTQIVAYVTPSSEEDLHIDRVRRSLMQRLPSYMVPSRVFVLEQIPLTANGKLDRKRLPAVSHARPAIDIPYSPPLGKVEEILAGIWEKVLDIHPVGRHDNYFDLGGDSLQAALLFVEIEREFGKKMPLSILMKAATVAEQKALLSKMELEKIWTPLVPVRQTGSRPPLFCFPGKGGNPIQFHHLAQHLDDQQPVYMLQSRGLGGEVAPYRRMEDITHDFIQNIREIQPQGPYYFVGSSFGGKVAYDIAQNLMSAGEKIALLAMIDTHGPGYPQYLPNMSRAKLYTYELAQYLGKHVSNLVAANWREKIAYVLHYLEQARGRLKLMRTVIKARYLRSKLPPEFDAVERANSIASLEYQPKPYSGKVVLFRANNQPLGIKEDPALGWGSVGIDELRIHEVPGHHGSILFEPRVKILAEKLKEYLIIPDV